MRVFAISDIHVDYPANMTWLLGLSNYDFRQDFLLLAGDVSDLPAHLVLAFDSLQRKFKRVFFLPGNHELWVHRCGSRDSFEKFDLVMQLARESGLTTEAWRSETLSIIPLLSWYDFSFGEPDERLSAVWADFFRCRWRDDCGATKVAGHFLRQNVNSLWRDGKTVISFSHFLPRIDLMPGAIPLSQRYLYPVLGSQALGAQINRLNPNIHVYGHSHVNRRVVLDGVRYVNNAFGYPSESNITAKTLLCIYDDEASRHAGELCCG